LLKLWELEHLSTEQVIGQLLQQGQQQSSALVAVQRRQDGLEQLLAALAARVTALEARR